MSQFDADLDSLLAGVETPIGALSRETIALVRSIQPTFLAKVAFGWSRVLFRHPRLGLICSVCPSRDRVLLMFQDGKLLDNRLLVDDGKVVKVRWIPLRPGDALPVDEIAILLAESIALRG